MQGRIQRFACALLAALALGLMGTVGQCSFNSLVVEIPDLEANRIEGLQLWRADDANGANLAEAGRIVFGDRFFEGGSEVLAYTLVDSADEAIPSEWPAALVRAQDGSGSVTLTFVFSEWTELPGWVRVSTFNAAGESELSDEAAFL